VEKAESKKQNNSHNSRPSSCKSRERSTSTGFHSATRSAADSHSSVSMADDLKSPARQQAHHRTQKLTDEPNLTNRPRSRTPACGERSKVLQTYDSTTGPIYTVSIPEYDMTDRQTAHATENVRENRAATCETDRRTRRYAVKTKGTEMADYADEKNSSTVQYYIVRKLRLAD
jgi:hypothetical protein